MIKNVCCKKCSKIICFTIYMCKWEQLRIRYLITDNYNMYVIEIMHHFMFQMI